jgi:hypothetical protein
LLSQQSTTIPTGLSIADMGYSIAGPLRGLLSFGLFD